MTVAPPGLSAEEVERGYNNRAAVPDHPRWIARWGREPYPGIHEYYWETPEQLANAVLSGMRAIQPGVPGRQTHLVRSLVRGVGGFGKMPLQGPFLSSVEIDEIVAWIDAGMPEGPPEEAQAGH